MMPSLCMIGWTYRMGASTLEEFLRIPENQWISSFSSTSREPFVFLATCNRLEFYFVSDTPDDIRFSFLNGKLKRLTGSDALDHLLRVSCGLDSLSVGEGEILGQVKRAYDEYLKRGMKNLLLTEVFVGAIRAGKAVRKKTGISNGKVSVPSVFTEMLKQHSPMKGTMIAVIGSGKMGMGFVRTLSQYLPSKISLIYRNYPPRERMVGLTVAPFSELRSVVPESDIVIAATTSKDPILFPDMFPDSRRYIIVDVSNPANVHPDVRSRLNVVYLDLSDLDRFVTGSLGERSDAIREAERIISDEAAKIERKVMNHLAEEFLGTLYTNATEIAGEEIYKFRKEFSKGKNIDELLDRMMVSFTNKMMHPISTLVRSIANDSPDSLQKIVEEGFSGYASDPYPPADRKADQSPPARSRRSTQKP